MAKNRYLYTGNPPPEGAEANISAAGLLWRHTHGLITPKKRLKYHGNNNRILRHEAL